MDPRSPDYNNGTTPRAYAMANQRNKASFRGCSRINDYELMGKLGEGTFGYDVTNGMPFASATPTC
jgi:serine/threonine-protein kinase BUR1